MNNTEALIAAQTQDIRLRCPECADDRKKSNTTTLSVTVKPNETLYDCHHCGFAGVMQHESMADQMKKYDQPKKITPIPTPLNHNSKIIDEFFRSRGISIRDMSALPAMTSGHRYFGGEGELPAVGFIYGNREQPEAIKWRSADKKLFTQQGTAAEFYGLDRLEPNAKELIIVEGEADVVALATIGVRAVSVPNGAPMKVSDRMIDPSEDKKFSYLWEARELLRSVEKIILAVDQDQAGDALAEEIARRVGRAKCWRTKYPDGCKDPTDVLRQHDEKSLRLAIDKSEAVPLVGVYAANDYSAPLMEAYLKGHGHGESTGMKSVDQILTIKEGLLYVVTGLPSSGKSEWCDQVMMNLARDKGWKWAVASFENPCHVHIAKLAEKYIAKPFYEGLTPRMNRTELSEALAFIDDHFVFLESRDGNLSTIESIIERTMAAILRKGCRGLVLDPYNYIAQKSNENEHQQINQMLTTIISFAQAYGVAIFFVAHPMKIYPREDGTMPVVKGMHISGSAAWFAKADVGITVHRGTGGVEIHCWKSRFKWIGQLGLAHLGYDVPTGRYIDGMPDKQWSAAPSNKSMVFDNFDDDDLEF